MDKGEKGGGIENDPPQGYRFEAAVILPATFRYRAVETDLGTCNEIAFHSAKAPLR